MFSFYVLATASTVAEPKVPDPKRLKEEEMPAQIGSAVIPNSSGVSIKAEEEKVEMAVEGGNTFPQEGEGELIKPEMENVEMVVEGGSSNTNAQQGGVEIDANLMVQSSQLLHQYCQMHDISMYKCEHMEYEGDVDELLADIRGGLCTVKSLVIPRLKETMRKCNRICKTIGTMHMPDGPQMKEVTVAGYAFGKKDAQRLVSVGFLQEVFGDKVGSGVKLNTSRSSV